MFRMTLFLQIPNRSLLFRQEKNLFVPVAVQSFGRAAQIHEGSLLLVRKLHHNSNLGKIVTVDESIISRSQGRRIEGCKRDFRVLDTPRIRQLSNLEILQILRSDIFKTPE
jgi:hypothetical protein